MYCILQGATKNALLYFILIIHNNAFIMESSIDSGATVEQFYHGRNPATICGAEKWWNIAEK